MIRRNFLRRMALAAAACAFIDVPWPRREPYTATLAVHDLACLVREVFVEQVIPAVRAENERWARGLLELYS